MMIEILEFRALYNWISSWRQEDGYGGFLHHAIHGTVNWEHARLVPSYTYEPLINGFLNLYGNTGDTAWLEKAEQAANDLGGGILDSTNQFKYSGFEFAPKSGSIVHTVNPLFAFMKLYKITGKKEYIDVCKKVLESVTCIFWRGDNFAGPFNMTLIVAAAMAEYGSITGDWRLHNFYGKKVFELVKEHKVEDGECKGLYYRNRNDHSIVFPWYNCVKANAMVRYGKATGNKQWIDEGISLLTAIKGLFYDDYTLPHSFQDGVKVDEQHLVAPAAFAVTIMQENGVMSEKEVESAIKSLLSKQSSIGFIPSNTGYDWRSKVGVTAWNAFVFELLSTRYILNSANVSSVEQYMFKEGFISGTETGEEFSLSYKNKEIVNIKKHTGEIKKLSLDEEHFEVKLEDVGQAIHVVKINKQRHLVTSYIDSDGKGIWLDSGDGNLYAWSPYSLYKIEDNKPVLNGKQRYDRFSKLLYSVVHPVLYHPGIVNILCRAL